jgi:hypothetical protein
MRSSPKLPCSPISGREVALAENGDSEGPIQITWTYYAQTADLGVPEPRPPVELPILPHNAGAHAGWNRTVSIPDCCV